MPSQLKESINQAYLENGPYEQILTHLQKELELSSLEAPDELQMNTVNKNNKLKATRIMLEVTTVTLTTLTPKITEMTEHPKLPSYPVEHVETQTTPQRKVTIEPMQQTSHFPGRTNRQYRMDLSYRTK